MQIFLKVITTAQLRDCGPAKDSAVHNTLYARGASTLGIRENIKDMGDYMTSQ